MKDPEIREVLKKTTLTKYLSDPDSKVVEELNLPIGKARIDMAVINGHFHGYEIKGASDTLRRLPNQIEAYTNVFDYLTIVTEEKYQKKTQEIAPEWVGISICTKVNGNHTIECVKKGQKNNSKKSFYIAKLLWHDELVHLLSETDISFKKKYRNWVLCELLAENIDVDVLSQWVRSMLKARKDWKIKEENILM